MEVLTWYTLSGTRSRVAGAKIYSSYGTAAQTAAATTKKDRSLISTTELTKTGLRSLSTLQSDKQIYVLRPTLPSIH
jgi:hypothetical protein